MGVPPVQTERGDLTLSVRPVATKDRRRLCAENAHILQYVRIANRRERQTRDEAVLPVIAMNDGPTRDWFPNALLRQSAITPASRIQPTRNRTRNRRTNGSGITKPPRSYQHLSVHGVRPHRSPVLPLVVSAMKILCPCFLYLRSVPPTLSSMSSGCAQNARMFICRCLSAIQLL